MLHCTAACGMGIMRVGLKQLLQAVHEMLPPSSSGAALRASDAAISSLLEGLVKQALHCLWVMHGGLKQLLEQATARRCPLLLALV